jgi:adenylate kinase family enzyme
VRRVAILGPSGAGKTTVGRKIAEKLDVPFVELDAIHWGAGWTEATADELRARVEPIVVGDRWVIDGLRTQGEVERFLRGL